MIKIIPLSLNLLSYLLKQKDRDIILMSDDFYYSSYPEVVKSGKKEKLQILAEQKEAKIYEFCGGPSTSWINYNNKEMISRSTDPSRMKENAIHAFFVVKNEEELEDRFAVIDVVNS